MHGHIPTTHRLKVEVWDRRNRLLVETVSWKLEFSGNMFELEI